MFFAKPGEYEACGMFTIGHLILLTITIIIICLAVKFTNVTNNNKIRSIIKKITIFVWILEIIKIVFNLVIGNANNPNTYIPLYYCSILLYAGIFSSFFKGKLKHVGEIFLETGGIVAGITFLIFPTTSITTYPIFHFISIQSFIYHGCMIYIGVIMNKGEYTELKRTDIKYYSSIIFAVSILAFIINSIYNTNLMFISKDFPGSPITILYKSTGIFYPIIMTIIQSTLPFYIVYEYLNKKVKGNKNEK